MGLLTTLASPSPPPNGDGEPAYDGTTGLPLYGADGMPMAGCCCDGEYAQWRRCSDGALVNLWSPPLIADPITGEPAVYPLGMFYRGDGKCYYRDGTEPLGPALGPIIGPAIAPDYLGDYVALPEGFDCSHDYCGNTACDIICQSGPTPKVMLVEFSGIAAPPGGCTKCSDPPDGYCAQGGALKVTAFNGAAVNRKFVCVQLDGCTLAWPANLIGKRQIIYNETWYDTHDCQPHTNCPTDPLIIYEDDTADPHPAGVYYRVSVTLAHGHFIVQLTQYYYGSDPTWLFYAQIPYAAVNRCDLAVAGAHNPTPIGAPASGGICVGNVRGSGGTVSLRRLT